ncbi:MAG: N-glycosylase/DNA lyase [Candidatus Gracilibacteria bacterium]|nr:N-glycosylase/DNA lyase [Candidatus Gracilibacteria bacterium]MDQ7022589.1 N-glycosylase/DNA lyase [Candidatus Gracilibacteria bacterium]
MQELYNKLKQYGIEDAIKIEESDRQYIALKKLGDNIENKEVYLSLIIANSIICYQLSGKGENYWEEFSDYFIKFPIFNKEIGGLLSALGKFIKTSKNNKRFIDTKIKRLKKLEPFLGTFFGKEDYFYKNMLELRDKLAKTMKQKNDAKTIVFAVKMFSYGARNIFDLIYFPEEISIPIDSRITKLFEKYKGEYTDISKFYFELSKTLNIPELHLDALVWVNYDELI